MLKSLLYILFFTLACYAEDIYISQSGSGTTNSLAWFNNGGNWGAGDSKISAGDTVHLVGTLSNQLAISGSGVAGSPITLYFEPNAKLSAPVFDTIPYKIIDVGGYSWITIDGGTNGLIECTDNGSSNTYSLPQYAIWVAGGSHVTVQNLSFYNLYKRWNSTDTTEYAMDGFAVKFTGGSDLMVTNCHLTNGYCGLAYIWNDGDVLSNVTFVANSIIGFGNCISASANGTTSGELYNVLIEKNYLDGFGMWNGKSVHHNAMYFFNNAPATNTVSGFISNITIRCNYVGSTLTDTEDTPSTTGGISFEMFHQNRMKRLRIYNNYLKVRPIFYWGNGFIPTQLGTDVLIANNTMVCWTNTGSQAAGGALTAGGSNVWIYNNLFIGVGVMAFQAEPINSDDTSGDMAAYDNLWSDFNILPNSNFWLWRHHYLGLTNYFPWQPMYANFAQWQAANPTHFDPNSTTNEALVDANYVPLTNSIAVGMGTNLYTWGITNDYNGNARPSTGKWDVGAFISGVTTPSSPKVANVNNLRVILMH